MYCHSCGNRISENISHCPSCGNKIAILQAVPANSVQGSKLRKSSIRRKAQPSNQDNKTPWWHTLAGILTAIAALLTAVVGLLGFLYTKIPPPPPRASDSWVIVLSGNRDLNNAKAVVQKAAAMNYEAKIYQSEGLYRPLIGPFRSKDNALSLIEKVRLNIQPDAYVEDLKKLCPTPKVTGEFYSCQ